ncbi:hypothetical protein B0H94_10933 [Salsuginibacillus halophilus]|uniref:Uncharacterized protein n=1 Tax=Salsuginibacillus halophilus TaxID=517424 RepID=A0A2P8HCP0_9BACI|nr:hypothetical protein [Salsuginibacillus halophilus]PSL43978.1 hypothetical protein B0H94_10933 [Salsuginibacillus halophilus]
MPLGTYRTRFPRPDRPKALILLVLLGLIAAFGLYYSSQAFDAAVPAVHAYHAAVVEDAAQIYAVQERPDDGAVRTLTELNEAGVLDETDGLSLFVHPGLLLYSPSSFVTFENGAPASVVFCNEGTALCTIEEAVYMDEVE